MNNLLTKRFAELVEQADQVEATATPGVYEQKFVDQNALLNWTVKVANLLLQACGTKSGHVLRFAAAESDGKQGTNHDRFCSMKAVFLAAKEDYEGGYLISVRQLVQAEVFSSELEQANELLRSKYTVAAAVIAGTVLETCIRDLCTRNQIPPSKLDKMNADLAKAGIYNGIMQKRITHLAAVRNSAAHGNKDEFATYDVVAMIDEIEQFLAQHLN